MKLRVRRRPREIEVERWDGPGDYVIPDEHLLHKGSVLCVQPGDYVAMPADGDWYPLAAEALKRDFDVLGLAGGETQREHDFSNPQTSCRKCGGASSGSCRGYVPTCPACKQPAAWGTASLYFYCVNQGQDCPMRGQDVWLQTRNDRWDDDALSER